MSLSNESPEEQLIPLDDLLNLAEIDEFDVEAAIVWWDERASDDFAGALE